jgi:hypothetical protein
MATRSEQLRGLFQGVLSTAAVLALANAWAWGQGSLERLEERIQSESATESWPEAAAGELPPPVPPGREESAPAAARPSLGVSVVDVTPELQARYHLAVRQGAVITNIREGTAAAKYGLPLGAAIVAVDGHRIRSANDLVAAIEAGQPGDQVEIAYLEGDRTGRKKVRLGWRPPEPSAVVPPPVAEPETPGATPRWGRTVPAEPPPLLGRLDGLLDRLIPADSPLAGRLPPIAPDREPSSLGPPADMDEVTLLRQQLQSLQRQLEQVQERLDRIEQHLLTDDPAVELTDPAANP